MSNMNKTSLAIKKKLSLEDYSKPVDQQDDKKAHQSTNKSIHQPTSEPAQRDVVKMASKPAVVSVKQRTGQKTKATYYLGKQEKEMITNMFINRLKKYGKADRSALICEAIRLLYENER